MVITCRQVFHLSSIPGAFLTALQFTKCELYFYRSSDKVPGSIPGMNTILFALFARHRTKSVYLAGQDCLGTNVQGAELQIRCTHRHGRSAREATTKIGSRTHVIQVNDFLDTFWFLRLTEVRGSQGQPSCTSIQIHFGVLMAEHSLPECVRRNAMY